MTLDNVEYFDENGRCIPAPIESPVHKKTRRYFLCNQPEIDYAKIHGRTVKALGMADAPSAAQFEQRAEAILASLQADPKTRNILKGVHVPFLLPKGNFADLGTALETTYLEAVRRSFSDSFPERSFANHHKGGLAGRLGSAPASRHDKLLASLQDAAVVGYYFPCLTEYSLPAVLEQMRHLPERFLLAGGVDTAAAFIGSPDLLLRTDGYPPLLWLAGLYGEKDGIGYHFEAYGYNLTFNRRAHLGEVAETWASGLVVLG